MMKLSDKEKQKAKKALIEQMDRLSSITAHSKAEVLPSLTPAHAADMADVASIQLVDLMLAKNEIAELNEIKRALDKLNHNQYGVCEKCEREISTERLAAIQKALDAVPWNCGSSGMCSATQHGETVCGWRHEPDWDAIAALVASLIGPMEEALTFHSTCGVCRETLAVFSW